MTIREFHAVWGDLCPRPDPTTTIHNRRMLNGWVAKFGDRPLEGVSVLEARRWALVNRGAIRYVKTFYADAIRLELCETCPLEGVKVPLDRGRADLVPPTQAEVRLLASAAGELYGAGFAALTLVAGTTGIRQGELGRIVTAEVEREPHVRIRLPRDVTKGRLHERLIVFAPGAEDAEGAFLEVLPEVGRVFPWDPVGIRRRWRDVRNELGSRVQFHELRHAAATWLVESGADPRDVAMMLHGHTDPSLVLELYAHPDREAAAARLRGVTS